MNKKIVSGIMLTLLLIGMLTLAFNIQPVKSDWAWTETIYIRADGSVDPPTAPILTVDNITYTLTDNIVGDVPGWSSAIVVERDDIVVDGAGYTLQGTRASGSKGIDLSGRSNVTIKNMEIKVFHYGIWLSTSSNIVISGNNITNNNDGIHLYYSSTNSVSGNNITNNRVGILLDHSSNSIISGNNITSNDDYGVYVYASPDNVLRNNAMTGNRYNFGVYGSTLSHFTQDVDDSNTVDGKPIYYLVNRQDMEVPSDGGYVALINSINITVEGLELKNNCQGILLLYTTNSQITNNNITNNWGGILLEHSSSNRVSGNTITNNYDGIALGDSSNNTIAGNTITNNRFGILLDWSSNNTVSGNNITNNWGGILLEHSSSNRVSGNTITENNGYGIYLLRSSNNRVSGNSITNNYDGIHLYDSSSNRVSGNTITNNYDGIALGDSSNNIIFHNNFVDNSEQARSDGSTNVWDDGYPSGGNYWSDYTGVDLYGGPYQNETGGDGIGDVPYEIDENNQDNYPFMQQNGWEHPVVYEHDLAVSGMQAPTSSLPEASTIISAIIRNVGLNNESDVEVQFLVDGSLIDSTIISQLTTMSGVMVSLLWTAPQTPGTYNLTIYAVPVPGENVTDNNSAYRFVTVRVVEPHAADAMWIQPSAVELSTVSVSVGYRFNVTVWINLTETSANWQFKMAYNKEQLSATGCGYTAGYKSQFFENISTISVPPDFWQLNATHNYVLHGESWVGAGPFRNPGYGSLSWVEFEVIAVPPEGEVYTSVIALVDVYPEGTETHAQTVADTDPSYIELTVFESTYRISAPEAPPLIRDVAITDVFPSSNWTYVGREVNITVVAKNKGNQNETFTITAYYNGIQIGNFTVSELQPSNETTITFVWNTQNTAAGNYTISAEASTVPFELNLTDNRYINGQVEVRILGDLNGDGKVRIDDVYTAVEAFGSEPGHQRWNPAADINGDNRVRVNDIFLIAKNFGKTL